MALHKCSPDKLTYVQPIVCVHRLYRKILLLCWHSISVDLSPSMFNYFWKHEPRDVSWWPLIYESCPNYLQVNFVEVGAFAKVLSENHSTKLDLSLYTTRLLNYKTLSKWTLAIRAFVDTWNFQMYLFQGTMWISFFCLCQRKEWPSSLLQKQNPHISPDTFLSH